MFLRDVIINMVVTVQPLSCHSEVRGVPVYACSDTVLELIADASTCTEPAEVLARKPLFAVQYR